jgi:hypothetical protein
VHTVKAGHQGRLELLTLHRRPAIHEAFGGVSHGVDVAISASAVELEVKWAKSTCGHVGGYRAVVGRGKA